MWAFKGENMRQSIRLAALLLAAATLACTVSIPSFSSISGSGEIITITNEAEITMPALSGIEASGASQVTLAGFDSSLPLRVIASGATSVIGEIQAGDVSMEASGASSISLTGGAGNLALDVSGASSADLEAFQVTDIQADLSGASSAVVTASGTLDVEASGASELSYLGNPTLGSVNTSGASSVGEK